ncbi:hypothetical protein C7S20_00315 [Christiangramia fulva]|uniref:Exostosin GT47 domain-containing protein n=1 Tax=Christiangramia fulva TaxID=2126553 RepID=A0A2R3Z0S7_9FLAO|nr:hypothetical protein [Christiangramia fulva]AVR43838.1 hypothetical protein C7S20_00315 [Christiangramia fulva]
MLLYRQRRKIIRYFRLMQVLVKTFFTPVNEKTIFFDTSEIAINRYLYCFLKMFQLEGYTVYITLDIKTANILCNTKGEFKYASWLISEKVIKFGMPSSAILEISKDRLSNAYYNQNKQGYRVPVCCYPWFYTNMSGFSNMELKENRKNSVFMSGNIDPRYYDSISDTPIFRKLPSRKKTADFLRNISYFYPVKNNEELNSFLNNSIDNKVIIIDSSQDFRIELETLPFILQKFLFYLALPGIVVPQSHNLPEAMLFGCIPIIHKEYAELLDPPLESFKNAIVFNSLGELKTIIEQAFELNDSEVKQIRQNVLEYYKKYLSPEAVVEKVLQGPERIFIQAERVSLIELTNNV